MVVDETPLARYEKDIHNQGFIRDPAQFAAMKRLQLLYDQLIENSSRGDRRFLSRFLFKKAEKIKGVYMWGGVGRGKTYLMDTFFESLPIDKKRRTHFHRFMRHIHSELNRLEGNKNPLEKIAEKLSSEVQLLCFDEFFVSDITDAMILGNLFKALFERGVILVATSNIPPQELYKNGLQRSRFLPAIALLQSHTEVVNVDGGTDYRLQKLIKASLYYWPSDQKSSLAMRACFDDLAPEHGEVNHLYQLEIEGRSIIALLESEDVVWFDFKSLCDGPRSQNDYIVLAMEYHTVLISNIPSFGRHNDDQARRFINLVDEFYDRKVKLIASAACSMNELYDSGRLGFEFERTVSRLLEMQSESYLSEPHRP